MSNLSIGLSGLDVAMRAIETAGNNMANAATEGYHRQEVVITPLTSGVGNGNIRAGGGSTVSGIRRLVDMVVEMELLRRQPTQAQIQQELASLRSIEGAIGDLSTEGLGTAIDQFFGALTELSGQPDSDPLRSQAVWAADTMAVNFHSIAGVMNNMGRDLEMEARTLVDQANGLTAEIADLNGRIHELQARGTPDNNLLDRRDQSVTELSQLMDIQVQSMQDGTINIMAGGKAIILQRQAQNLELGYSENGDLGLSIAGAGMFDAQTHEGRLGAILNLKNQMLPEFTDGLDDLAREIIQQVNAVHVQGVGTDGSFARLDGTMADNSLAAWDPPLSNGTIAVRIVDTATGEATRAMIAVDPSSADPAQSTLAGIAGQFDALTGIKASVLDHRLHIESDTGYTFDFLPTLLSAPTTSTLTGTSVPTVSGMYTGDTNATYTCSIVGMGTVGVTPDLTVEVRDGDGHLAASLNVGVGYAAGDVLTAANGIQIQLAAGTLNDGETFTIDALAQSDTSGFLAGAGINAFFQGNSALSIGVREDLLTSPGRLATATGTGFTDNINARRMAALATAEVDGLDGTTFGDFFRQMVADVGQKISIRQARGDALERTITQLENQRDDLSGVDINEEASKLILFEQMFQAMAKYLTTSQAMQQSLFAVVGSVA